MPQIKDAELWFAKVDPKRPNRKFNKKNPTWEVQLRTSDKAVKKQWESMNLNVKTIDPDDGDLYYRVNLRKKTIKADGEEATPVEVVYGDMSPVDPGTIGNGSIGNVRIFQYDYENDEGQKGVASVLMGIQLTKHIRYTPKPRDDEFGETTTEIVEEEDTEETEGTEDSESQQEAPEAEQTAEEGEAEEAPPKKTTPSVKKKDKFD